MEKFTQESFKQMMLDEEVYHQIWNYASHEAASFPGVEPADLFQQAWIQVLEHLQKRSIPLAGQAVRARVIGYMKTTIYHVAIDFYRDRLPQVEDLPEHEEFFSQLGVLEAEERHQALTFAIGRLCAKCRRVVWVKFSGVGTLKALTKEFGFEHPDSVSNLLSKCLKQIKQDVHARLGDL